MKVTEECFSKVKKDCFQFIKSQETKTEKFSNKDKMLKTFLIPMCFWIANKTKIKKPYFVGLAGGQGTGKTTISSIVKIILEKYFKLKVFKISIDDFYKTRKERLSLSKKVHPMLMTRGVPGTHDVQMMLNFFKKAKSKNFKKIELPDFNKAIDDRSPKKYWYKLKEKPDIVIFEGWCVGAKYQKKNLKKAVNILEKHEDAKLKWRKKVNNELKTNYKRIFQLIDKQIFLKVPNLKYVYKWRELQEKKLRSFSKGKKTMDKKGIYRFIMHYERLTRDMINDLSKTADVLINIDKKHKLKNIKFNYQ